MALGTPLLSSGPGLHRGRFIKKNIPSLAALVKLGARLAAILTLPPGLFMHFGIFVQTVSAPFYKKNFLYHKIQKSETNYLIFL